jgi:hypothetical protein
MTGTAVMLSWRGESITSRFSVGLRNRKLGGASHPEYRCSLLVWWWRKVRTERADGWHEIALDPTRGRHWSRAWRGYGHSGADGR